MIDLDTLKMVVRGLVVSNPAVMTIETLCRDYRTSEGRELPYRQLGFCSAVDLLYELRDTVRISGNIVRVVSSEETAHLESLISRQKKSRRRGKPTSGFHRKVTPLRHNMPPRFQKPASNYSTFKGSGSSSSYSAHSGYRSSPSVSQSSYRRPQHSEFQNEEVRSRSPEENRRRPQYCVDESEEDSEEEHYNEFEVVTPSNGHDFEMSSTYDVDDFVAVKDSLYVKADNNGAGDALDLASNTLDIDSITLSACNGSRATVKEFLDSDDDISISPKMQQNLREIIQAYPSGLRCARLPEEYLRRFGVPLDCRQCGYVSVNQMAMALPAVFRCIRINSGDWMLFDARQPPAEQFLNSANDDESAPEVSGRVLERISSILSTKCRGVSLNDIAVNYMILYGSPLLDDVDGFETMEDLFKSLSKTKVVVVREANGEMVVSPSSTDENDLSNEALPIELTWEEIHSTLPPTACRPEEKCPQITLPKKIDFGEYVVVRLGEIYSPWKFWIHLYGPEYSKKLDKLMDNMQEFYRDNVRKYFIPIAQWKRGQHCVALYEHEWHRAEILSIVDKDRVKLKYFDYGTIETVKKTDLRLLDRQFLSLPRMAIKAKLSAIKPAKGQKVWSQAANEYFFSLIDRKILVASVVKVLHDPPFLAIALVNTERGEDVHINDLLVESGFAEFITAGSDSEWSDDPVEPDYVELVNNAEKKQSEVNKSSVNDETNISNLTPSTREPAISKGVAEVPIASAVDDTTKSSKLSKKNKVLNIDDSMSNAEIISSCMEIAQSSPAPSQGVTPAQETPALKPSPPVLKPVAPLAPTSAPPRTVGSAPPLPNSNNSPRPCRPPPGFSAIGPMKAPPGLTLQGSNMLYMNNTLRPPNAGPPNMPSQLPLNAMYPNMMNPLAFNRLPFNQMPLNTGLQFPQFTGFNQVMAQQLLMTQMRPNAPPMQPWPVNVANPWNVPYNNNPYNPYMFRQPSPNNNQVFRPQNPLQQNQPFPNPSYQAKPTNKVPLNNNNNNNNNVSKKSEEKVVVPSSKLTLSVAEAKSQLDDVANATEALPSLLEKMALKTPSPPPPPAPVPPPGLTPPPTPPSPVDEPAKEAEVSRLPTDVSYMSFCEESLFCEEPECCPENESTVVSSSDAKFDYRPVFEGELEELHNEPGTPKHQTKSPEDECDLALPPRLLWKPLDVDVGVVHLLNLNGEALVSSDELARVCLKKNGHEDLAKVLASKSVADTFLQFKREDNREFFRSLDLCPGLKEIMRLKDKSPQCDIHLIPLMKVVGALIAAGIKTPKVVFAFQNARRDFNPNDDYWQLVCENPTVTS